MTTRLIVARHGNTFEKHETPRRVGARTDIPLTIEGREQGRRIGHYLVEHGLIPDVIFTSRLQRTVETGYLAMTTCNISVPMRPFSMFDEVDYGPDENKTEAEVIDRVGSEAIKKWDREAIPPEGWKVHPEDIKNDWIQFSKDLLNEYTDETILVVTSNGVARFSPILTNDFEGFKTKHPLKLSTGALSIYEWVEDHWDLNLWNYRPASSQAA